MTTISRVVFVLLVGATFAAFFVAQRLKSAPPVVSVRAVTEYFSPNGDGRKDVNRISVQVKEADDVTITIVDPAGNDVRQLLSAVPARPFRPVRAEWDGRTDAGGSAPDGSYRLRIGLRRAGRAVTLPRHLQLDTTPPTPRVIRVDGDAKTPGDQWISGPVSAPVRLTVSGVSRRKATQFEVLRTDAGAPRAVAAFNAARAGSRRGEWDGRDASGAPVPAGTYLIVASVEDRAGNIGRTPALPPEPGRIPGRPGVAVRTLVARPPVDPVRAGARVRFAVDSRGRPYRWRIRRIGESRPRRRGRERSGGEATLRAPGGVSGLYLFEARAGKHATAVPFAVQGADPAPILVVVPAITWFGRNLLDDDRDGLPNTLENGSPARYPQLLAGGLPAGLADELAPLLVFLDRQGLRYDITTDLALTASRAGLTRERAGVLLAGPLRWIPRGLARRLRRYAADGGTVASFGAGTLRRGVDVARDRLLRPLPATADDPFGARLRPVRTLAPGAAPLLPQADAGGTGLLTGVESLPGFRVLEESAPSGRVLAAVGEVDERAVADAAAAGEPPPEPAPALTLSRLGKGRVIRVGLPEWGRRLARDAQVQQLTRNIADLLRGVRPRIRSFR